MTNITHLPINGQVCWLPRMWGHKTAPNATKQLLHTYIVEAYKDTPEGTLEPYRFKVKAHNQEQAQYKADLIAQDYLLSTWLVYPRIKSNSPKG